MNFFLDLLRIIWGYLFIKPKVFVLRMCGATVGKDCRLYNAIRDYDLRFSKHLVIGNSVTIARGTIILTHDSRMLKTLNKDANRGVRIGDNVFIGVGCIILPGVTIEENAIIGAGSVVTKAIPANCFAAGNPARVLQTR